MSSIYPTAVIWLIGHKISGNRIDPWIHIEEDFIKLKRRRFVSTTAAKILVF